MTPMRKCIVSQCGDDLSEHNRSGMCRRHYERTRKRSLYTARKAAGYRTDEPIGIRELRGEVPMRRSPLPPAGGVTCGDCAKTFTTMLPYLDATCAFCGSHRLARQVA